MGGYVPEEIVENIRLRADIVQIISDYVTLQKKGRNYVGHCPFHQENDPSFTVTPDKQIFYCFGCNAGGNVFKFIMLQHNLTFPEAVKMLGERVGVAVPDGYSPQMRERLRREEKAWKVNALARDFFQSILLQHPEAAAAREYIKVRGITGEVIKDFGLGYALSSWDALIKFMHGKGIGVPELLEVGLAASGERKAYDRFRSRLMFPIADARGRVAGFGGRVLGDGLPKYLNTAETEYFSKGKILYGLDRARQAIGEAGYVIITEGYMDAIAVHQFGMANAVASLGTSMTQEHGRLLLN
jgi:DNA primase